MSLRRPRRGLLPLLVLAAVLLPWGVPANAGAAAPEFKATDAQVADGRDLFTGATAFDNGGTPCAACHDISGLGGAGGGRLGPDLTTTWQSYAGEAGLVPWLKTPSSPTMKPIFSKHGLTDHDIKLLVAYMGSRAQASGKEGAAKPVTAGVHRFRFVGMGIGGAVVLLVLLGMIWSGRNRSVRQKMVDDSKLANRGAGR